MRTQAAENLADAVSHLFTDADGEGTYSRQYAGTRRRGASTEREDRVVVLELERVLNLDVARYMDSGRVTTEDDNPFENMTQAEFILSMGAAREHRPPLIEWACNLRVHRDLCRPDKGCLCIELKFPDQITLFARSLSPKEAMIDLDLIRIYVRTARTERKRWESVQRASGKFKPHHLTSGHSGPCSRCDVLVEVGDDIYEAMGLTWHGACEVAV